MEYNQPKQTIAQDKQTKELQPKKVSFEEWLDSILSIHPPPTILMIAIDEDGKFSLLGAASNSEAMSLVLQEKAIKNPLVG